MKRILDYEEMQELLDSLDKNIIKKHDPIGYTNFGYPIDHYSYGSGDNHVIVTAGTHSAELITNIFVIRFMEKLSNKEIFIDPNVYTIDFIPFVNPEGTDIVTSTIRTLISRDLSENEVQTYCLTYYRNSFIEGKYDDRDIKLQHWMFRYADENIIKNDNLKAQIKKIIDENNLPKGCLINWSSNGRGVDLNSNIISSKYIDRVKNGEEIYNKLHLNTIRRDLLGPVGRPFYDKPGELEKENEALLRFYEKTKNEYNLIGSVIYHSCGNIVYYLNKFDNNPWNENCSEKDIEINKKVAKKYADIAKYKLNGREEYTTMDSMLKTLYPVSILVELGGVRATPLSQFIDFDLEGSNEDFKYVYSKIINDNTNALLQTIEEMLKINNG